MGGLAAAERVTGGCGGGRQVQGGPTGQGEAAEALRVLFGTTATRLRQLNADLGRQTAAGGAPLLPAGTVLCVMPDSCGTDA